MSTRLLFVYAADSGAGRPSTMQKTAGSATWSAPYRWRSSSRCKNSLSTPRSARARFHAAR